MGGRTARCAAISIAIRSWSTPSIRPTAIDPADDFREVSLLCHAVCGGGIEPAWMLPRACRPDVSTNELHRVTVLLDYGASLDDRGPYEVTALHYAVRGGKLNLIKLLLERGARVNAPDEDGLTPLLHLSKTRSKADPIPVMELLAASGADVDARDKSGGTLLMHFARQGKAEPVRWLLAHGADRNARNSSGKTAAQIGRAHAGIVRLLTK